MTDAGSDVRDARTDAVTDHPDTVQTDASDNEKPVDVQMPDTGVDVAVDTGVDVVMDSGVDVAMDSGVDVVMDTGVDVVMDTGVDVVMDTGVDVAMDVPVDVVAPTCAYPVAGPLVVGTPVMGTLATTGNIAGTMCQTNAHGGEAIYWLHVTSTSTIRMWTTSSIDTVLSVRTACDVAASEVACNDDGALSLNSAVIYTFTPGDYFVIVDQYGSGTATSGGAFTLNSELVTASPAANSMCAGAVTLTPGTPITADLAAGAASSSACADGRELFYSLTIPAGSVAHITETSNDANLEPEVGVQDTCGATTCVDGDTGSPTAPASVDIINSASTPRTVIVSAGAASDGQLGQFTLAASVTPLPNVCTGATALTSGMMLTGQDLNTATTPVDAYPGCGTGPSNNLFYTIDVPANSDLTVTVAPTGFDAVVRRIDACTIGACLARVNGGGSGSTETLRVRTTTAQTVIVGVGSYNTTLGTFAISATVAPVPYTITSGTAMCDDLSTVTPVSGVTTDDSVSTIAALPIPFNFFGVAQSSYTVTSNGFLQLYTGTTGTGSTEYANVAIPSTSTPNRYIAPFWDDLVPAPTGETSDVRVLNVTTGTPHFTVQWTNWRFSGSTARLTFQAQLFPTSNRIEYHYCTLTPGDAATRVAGDEATIGVENSTGTSGIQYEYNGTPAANTVTQGMSLIFTPAP